jgi:hypothetical protein
VLTNLRNVTMEGRLRGVCRVCASLRGAERLTDKGEKRFVVERLQEEGKRAAFQRKGANRGCLPAGHHDHFRVGRQVQPRLHLGKPTMNKSTKSAYCVISTDEPKNSASNSPLQSLPRFQFLRRFSVRIRGGASY